jgi:hypothetical protein
MNSMTQADDVPTNTSATTLPAGLILARAQVRGALREPRRFNRQVSFAMLIELHTNARLFAPDNVALPMLVSRRNVQRDFVGNT